MNAEQIGRVTTDLFKATLEFFETSYHMKKERISRWR